MEGGDPLTLLDELLPVYAELLQRLEKAGAEWVQMDEPMLVMDLEDEQRAAYEKAYASLTNACGLKLLLTSYFGGLRDNLQTVCGLPVHGLHVDLVREPDQLEDVLSSLPESMTLSLGVVDGRNVWRNDLDASLKLLRRAAGKVGAERLCVAPSCSLLHTPVDLAQETDLDPQVKRWLAFAMQKLEELSALARAVNEGDAAVSGAREASREAAAAREASEQVHRQDVQQRVQQLKPEDAQRAHAFSERRGAQREALGLPLMPTTTIGSFPQTPEIRKQRAAHRKGELTDEQHTAYLKEEIQRTVSAQEEIGLDVLVHGEPERTDMVEYFGEQLTGLAFTRKGWVQSYGSRCVRPPIIYGDVSRPAPMTVEWSKYAQSLTDKPMKGMLTGPITILQWSFVRNDQPRSETAKQIALAIRDEVADLEEAGIRAIQIDEPALREGLPLRRADWNDYLEWAVRCFRIASCVVQDRTQIHTHMCYAEFNDIIEAIADLDADVISMEASRSRMELLEAFGGFSYPNAIGPGVYDIHAPRVPSAEEMADLLRRALGHLRPEQVWVNPDCGLKTRKWEEVRPALENMVRAAGIVRAEQASQPA
jgi:5-methyltetrahydropteroyltriglutamate--homocysteine methyltransferase